MSDKEHLVIVKPVGSQCNFTRLSDCEGGCKYCFYKGNIESHSSNTRGMGLETAERYVKQLVQLTSPRKPLMFFFQGGEPLLRGLDFYEKVMQFASEHAPDREKVLWFQTNGSLIDERWCEFFTRNNAHIGLSCDGPEGLNGYRLDRNGDPTIKRVEKAAEMLNGSKTDWAVTCSVHDLNEHSPKKVYRYFTDTLKAKNITFIPIVTQDNNGNMGHSVSEDGFGSFLCTVADEYFRNKDFLKGIFVSNISDAVLPSRGEPTDSCVQSETCGMEPVLERTGDVYPCDYYVSANWRLGNINQHGQSLPELMESQKQKSFAKMKSSLPQQCLSCDVLEMCHGGCPKDRISTNGLNYLCPSYRIFYRYINL